MFSSIKKSLIGLATLLFFLLLCSSRTSFAQEIIIWHSLDGALGEKFVEIVNTFNQRSETLEKGIKVLPEFKGNYEETLREGFKVIGTHKAPQVLQVFEMGTLVMQANPKHYVPLDKLSDKPSPLLSIKRFIPAISALYKGRHGETELASLPFGASSVILFYNKDALRKASLDPEQSPETWEAFEKIALILKSQGAKNVLAAGWLSGHHIDQLAAWHDQPIATKGNGIDGDGAELIVNRPFFIHHLKKLANWYQMNIFSLETRVRAEKAFAREEVVFLTQGPNRLPDIEKLVEGKFEIGVAKFPYWQERVSKPQNTIAGGASFWALAGHNPKVYPAIQKFFEYLVSPEVQAKWHQETGYMPVVTEAVILSEKQKFYEKSLKGKAAKIALDSFMDNPPKEYSRGILLPKFPKVRDMMVQEMKEAIKGNKTAEQALDQIVTLGNEIMQEKSES